MSKSYRLNQQKTISPSKTIRTNESNCLNSNNLISSNLYFCHYRNAVYMGPVKNFKKEGKGILLHDNGTSLLCHYQNDHLHGLNLLFSQHCLLSAEFNKGKLVEAVYRTYGFLVYLHFNQDQLLEGKCSLLNFSEKSLTYATFHRGILL